MGDHEIAMAKKHQDWDSITDELEILVAHDFRIHEFSEHHFRINERLDVWPTRRRWYDLKSHQRGFYTSMVELVHNFLGYKPIAR